MNIRILLLCLAIPNCMLSMLKKEDLKKFVQSYELVDKIPHEGNFVHSLLPIPGKNQLIATIDKDLISFDCETHTPTPIPTKICVTDLTFNPDKNIFYGNGGWPSMSLVVGNPQDYTCEVLGRSLNLHGTLTYSSGNKQLYSGLNNRITILNHDGSTSSWNALNSVYDAYVKTMCCNESENTLCISSSRGDIEKRSTSSGKFIKSINVCKDKPIERMVCDQSSGFLFVDTGKEGIIEQYDANLENPQEILYGGFTTRTQTLTQDTFSKLLCITSINNDRKGLMNVHFLHHNNQTIQFKIPITSEPQSTACDPATGTFFVGTPGEILVFQPKKSYLALLNQSAYTVFKIGKGTLR